MSFHLIVDKLVRLLTTSVMIRDSNNRIVIVSFMQKTVTPRQMLPTVENVSKLKTRQVYKTYGTCLLFKGVGLGAWQQLWCTQTDKHSRMAMLLAFLETYFLNIFWKHYVGSREPLKAFLFISEVSHIFKGSIAWHWKVIQPHPAPTSSFSFQNIFICFLYVFMSPVSPILYIVLTVNSWSQTCF